MAWTWTGGRISQGKDRECIVSTNIKAIMGKDRMTLVDVMAVVKECRQLLGMRLANIYSLSNKAFIISIVSIDSLLGCFFNSDYFCFLRLSTSNAAFSSYSVSIDYMISSSLRFFCKFSVNFGESTLLSSVIILVGFC